MAISIAWAAQPAERTRPAAGAEAALAALGASGIEPGGVDAPRSRSQLEMASGALDASRVRSHVRLADLDPNAPSDVPLISLFARTDASTAKGAFRPLRLRRELQWAKEWLKSDRFSLIRFRRERPQEWHSLPEGLKAVPVCNRHEPWKTAT